jgi:hypothetical protein
MVFEVMIFDENLITEARDLIIDGSRIIIEASIRKDEGGTRISAKKIIALDDFIINNKPKNDIFEDIQKGQKSNYKNYNRAENSNYSKNNFQQKTTINNSEHHIAENKINNNANNIATNNLILPQITVTIKDRDVLFGLKAFLQQRLMASDNNACEVIIAVINDNVNDITKISLGKNYKITNEDLLKIRKIPKIINANIDE